MTKRKSVKAANSRSEFVRLHLLQAIFSGKYPPGSPLREIGLARELGVSQATVREVLQRIEYLGLVTRTANVGTTVTRLTPADVRERMELRALLEVRAATAAAERIGADEVAELERLLSEFRKFVDSDLYFESAQADLNFHRYVWKCSGNATLCTLLEQLTVPLIAFASIMLSYGGERLADVVHEHKPMIDAMLAKDPVKIEEAFRIGAESFYQEYLGNGHRGRAAKAFGLMAT